MSTGKCRYCGYTPVGQNAMLCPSCMGSYPNPSRSVKWVNRLIIGIVLAGFAIFGLAALVIFAIALG